MHPTPTVLVVSCLRVPAKPRVLELWAFRAIFPINLWLVCSVKAVCAALAWIRCCLLRLGQTQRSLGELVRARMGKKVLDNLVAPVVSGVYSTHPDMLDIDAVIPGLREGLKNISP